MPCDDRHPRQTPGSVRDRSCDCRAAPLHGTGLDAGAALWQRGARFHPRTRRRRLQLGTSPNPSDGSSAQSRVISASYTSPTPRRFTRSSRIFAGASLAANSKVRRWQQMRRDLPPMSGPCRRCGAAHSGESPPGHCAPARAGSPHDSKEELFRLRRVRLRPGSFHSAKSAGPAVAIIAGVV